MKMIRNFVKVEKQQSTATRAFLPSSVLIPCNSAKEKKFSVVVKKNEMVEEGQVIASSLDKNSQAVCIHASVPGRIEDSQACFLPDGRVGTAIKIKTCGKFSYLGKKREKILWQQFSPDSLIEIIASKGVINTFSQKDTFALQLESCKKRKTRLLIVRMFDEDPSRATDTFIAKQFTNEVLEGALISARAMNAQGIVFALPKKASFTLNEELLKGIPTVFAEADTKMYPSGFSQNLIQLTKKTVRGSSLEQFKNVNRNCVFVDPETLYSVYEAVVFAQPVLDTFVHVMGSCLKTSALLRIRIGASLESIAEQCGGFKTKPAKIIINGKICGSAVSSLKTAITRQVKSVSFIPAAELEDQTLSRCIRCGKCRAICPEGIFPDLLFRHRIGGKPVGNDLMQTSLLCSGCALCNSVCPARLPLCQIIELVRNSNNEIK